METFSFRPDPEAEERFRIRVNDCKVWVVRLRPPVGRLFCDSGQLATIREVDYGLTWAGLGATHFPRTSPTDRDGVWCCAFDAPMETLLVEERLMRDWMAILRANGAHGSYRMAGTAAEYEF